MLEVTSIEENGAGKASSKIIENYLRHGVDSRAIEKTGAGKAVSKMLEVKLRKMKLCMKHDLLHGQTFYSLCDDVLVRERERESNLEARTVKKMY